MDADNTGTLYYIWGVDQTAYGPVELPTLVDWIKDERVTAETWINLAESGDWKKAGQLPELKMFFKGAAARTLAGGAGDALKPGALRRIKILAEMSDAQLENFARYATLHPVRQWAEVIRLGEQGEAMYLILEGELRVRLMVNGKETLINTLQAGEFFGEIALFDNGPRSADVVANKDCLLAKITAAAFADLVEHAPDIAAPFLFAVGKTLAARIRADNKRFRDAVAFARSAGGR